MGCSGYEHTLHYESREILWWGFSEDHTIIGEGCPLGILLQRQQVNLRGC
jgi:hypothetical protein